MADTFASIYTTYLSRNYKFNSTHSCLIDVECYGGGTIGQFLISFFCLSSKQKFTSIEQCNSRPAYNFGKLSMSSFTMVTRFVHLI